MRRRSRAALVALLVPWGPLAAAAPAAAEPGPPAVVIEGKGFGHGVGMPQDGALALATGGASASAILSRFYPGTVLARRTGSVRVGVYDAPGAVTVVLPGGGEVRDAPSGAQSAGFPVTVNPGGSVSLAFDGAKYKATPLAGAAITRPVAAPVPASPAATVPTPPATPPTTNLLDPLLQALLPTTVPPTTARPQPAAGAAAPAPPTNAALTSRGLWVVPRADSVTSLPGLGRSYRGTLIAAAAGRGLQLTNELDVEQYLRGMGEMPSSWPRAALEAQAIAARTFAIRSATAGKTLCDDQQCQVYIGAGNESEATSAAVTATRGQVLTYQGSLAETVYSASAGGVTGTAEEGFGPDSPDLPYLKPVEYPLGDPQVWSATLPLAAVAARFSYRGELQEVRVSRTGPSGRPLEITLDGDHGPMAVDAHRFFSVLQLRSTLYTLRPETPSDAAAGDALGAELPDFRSLVGVRADPVVARPAPPGPRSRGGPVTLAVLLLLASATAVRRARAAGAAATPAPAPSGAGPPA